MTPKSDKRSVSKRLKFQRKPEEPALKSTANTQLKTNPPGCVRITGNLNVVWPPHRHSLMKQHALTHHKLMSGLAKLLENEPVL